MTKIKNTKKGMAKKTLSVSLAVAMLATSNVPVWAAEFSDGSEAAFTAEAPVEVEAPVVEETVEAPVAEAVDSRYNVEIKDLKSSIQWGTDATVKIKVTDSLSGVDVSDNLYVRYLEGGVQETYGTEMPLKGFAVEDGYVKFKINFLKKTDVGKKFQIQIYEKVNDKIDWTWESNEITVAKKEISGTIRAHQTRENTVSYNGKIVTTVPKIDLDLITYNENIDNKADVTGITNYQITGEDIVNSYNVSGKDVVATGDIQSAYYTGKVAVTFQIWRKEITKASDAVKVDLPAYSYQYTGNNIIVKKENIKATDILTGKEVADSVTTDLTIDGSVGEKTPSATIDAKKGSFVNSVICKNGAYQEDASWDVDTQKVTVAKRDLADTANTSISIRTVTQDLLGIDTNGNSYINADRLKNNLTITDVSTEATINNRLVSIDFNGSKVITVEPGKTYTATVRSNDSNVINSKDVTFTVVAHDLNSASFTNEETFKNTNPTLFVGEQITKGITSANLIEKLGAFETFNGKPLIANVDYDPNVQFGENLNVGKGQIIIKGLGSYAGSQKIIEFNIGKRTADTVVVPEKTLYDDKNVDGEDYSIETSVTAKCTDFNNKVITVPANDYKVERKIVTSKSADAATGKNVPGNYIQTKVTLTNANGNFTNSTVLYGYTQIVNKAIKETDVVLAKTSYTYTGADIYPEYTVTVDGVTLEKNVDYTETVSHNKNVGTAVLTITGKGDYDTTSVSKEFTITPANTEDVKIELKTGEKITYNGTKHADDVTEKLEITLNGNDVKGQFTISYPTSKTANINAGTGSVILTPVKKNENFVGTKNGEFTISPATLTGTLNVYDEKGTKINTSNYETEYDETSKTFAKEVFKETGIDLSMKVTSDDYEIIYRDNVSGDANGKGHVLVVAKGNYATNTTYTCKDNTVVKNVVCDLSFTIKKLSIAAKNVKVGNGTYNGGFDVEPTVTVTVDGKTLIKDVDYKLEYPSTIDRKNVTNGKTLSVKVVGINGYKDGSSWVSWGIDKFDLANADILVSGTDADPVVKVMNGSVLVDTKEYDLTVADGKVTITATKDNKNYTGTQTVDIKHELEKPVAPMIADVQVVGNTATIILSGESEGAVGYDYVISKDRDCITNKDYDKVNRNILTTETDVTYVQQGMYYAYCHAWRRDEDGKKVFSGWSNAFPFSVTAITPDQPVITSVKASGSTVTVTYTKAANATGYDVVLGTSVKKVAGENRPVNYGTLVKKNINGNTVTATFKNVPAGTYYAGLHAFNRTSEDGKKVFSPWSNVQKVIVK